LIVDETDCEHGIELLPKLDFVEDQVTECLAMSWKSHDMQGNNVLAAKASPTIRHEL
jgi:hypothetical protein